MVCFNRGRFTAEVSLPCLTGVQNCRPVISQYFAWNRCGPSSPESSKTTISSSIMPEPTTSRVRNQRQPFIRTNIYWISSGHQPQAKIIESAVLSRVYNVFEGARTNVRFIDGCNKKAREFNDRLEKIASRSTRLEFCLLPTFEVERRTANRREPNIQKQYEPSDQLN